MVSITTRHAAGSSVSQASTRSSRCRCRSISNVGAAMLGAGTSGERAHRLFQEAPGLVAELSLPLSIEARLAQGGTEGLGVGLIEDHALRLQIALQALVEMTDVVAVLQGGRIEVALDDPLQLLRQLPPGRAVGEEPEAVPHMVGDRAVLLHLVELGDRDDRERVLLAL